MEARGLWFVIYFVVYLVFTAAVNGQQLKPTEIIYSRMPADPSTPPTGTNQPSIWAVGQDGSNDRFITYGTKPRISDDGRFLVFLRFTRNSCCYNPVGGYADFYVRELPSGQETLIRSLNFDNNNSGFALSPESNQGAYEIIADSDCFLYKFNRDGTNTFRFPWGNADYCFDDFPTVRRGGDQLIAFSNNVVTPGAGGIYTVGIDGAARQKIPNTTCKDFYPAWSNDNQFIAFGTLYFQNCSNNFPSTNVYPYWFSNLVKIKPDGTGRLPLTNFPSTPDCSLPTANCMSPGYVWTENNSRIIAAGRINGVRGLFTVSADGSGTIQQIPISAGNAPEFVGALVQPRVEQNVLSVGGGVTSGGNYTLVSTIGEAVAGITSAGGQFIFESGFWATDSLLSRRSPFDFDGDGKTDISIFRPSGPGGGEWWYQNSSDQQVAALVFGTSTDVITPSDFTGDGKTDVAFFRPSTASWFILRSENGSFYSFPFGSTGDIPMPADYDGDGKSDPAIYRPGNSLWVILRSSDGQAVFNTFGITGDQPVAADYDGDGKADIGIFRPSGSSGSGEWWIQRTSLGLLATVFGQSTDKTVPGDYTGDGKADVALWRPSNGNWFVLRSEDFSFFAFPWGASGDLPAPGDYDGDGKFDAALFRASQSTWFVLRSTSGPLITGFGLPTDQPVPGAFVR
jgi:hypothetical protein